MPALRVQIPQVTKKRQWAHPTGATGKVDIPPKPLRLVRSASFTAALREICEELFKICDRNNNGFIDRDEYEEVTKAVHSLFLPKERMHWAWNEMDKDKDGKVSLSEWLSGTEAIADFVGEQPFLTALLQWSKLERCGLDVGVDHGLPAKSDFTHPFDTLPLNCLSMLNQEVLPVYEGMRL